MKNICEVHLVNLHTCRFIAGNFTIKYEILHRYFSTAVKAPPSPHTPFSLKSPPIKFWRVPQWGGGTAHVLNTCIRKPCTYIAYLRFRIKDFSKGGTPRRGDYLKREGVNKYPFCKPWGPRTDPLVGGGGPRMLVDSIIDMHFLKGNFILLCVVAVPLNISWTIGVLYTLYGIDSDSSKKLRYQRLLWSQRWLQRSLW